MKKFSKPPSIIVINETQYILDGGNLIYKMGNWKKQTTFHQIAMQCVAYVTRNFGKNVVLVFNGYPQNPTTKDDAHKSRAQSAGTGPDVQVTATTKLAIKKDVFLSNTPISKIL